MRGCRGSDAHHEALAKWVIAGGDPGRLSSKSWFLPPSSEAR